MRDPAVCIADFILLPTALGVWNSQNPAQWNVCVGALPSVTDRTILVNQTGGRNPYPHLSYNEPSMQVIVRGPKSGYVEARAKMDEVVTRLLGLNSVTVTGGDVWRFVNQMGDIIWLGQDDNTRPMFSANFWGVVLPVASGNRVSIN